MPSYEEMQARARRLIEKSKAASEKLKKQRRAEGVEKYKKTIEKKKMEGTYRTKYSDIGYSDGLPKMNPKGEMKIVEAEGGLKNPGYKMTLQTEERICEVAKRICDGDSRQSVIGFIEQQYHVGRAMANDYYASALRWLVPEDLDEYQKGLVQANIERLEKIIEKGITNSGNDKKGSDYLKAATQAIAELNRMLGVGGQNVKIAQKSENGSEQIIQINFD